MLIPKIGLRKIIDPKKFGSNKILDPTNFMVQQNFPSNKILGPTQFWVQTIMGPKIFGIKNDFSPKNLLDYKKFEFKRLWIIFGTNKIKGFKKVCVKVWSKFVKY